MEWDNRRQWWKRPELLGSVAVVLALVLGLSFFVGEEPPITGRAVAEPIESKSTPEPEPIVVEQSIEDLPPSCQGKLFRIQEEIEDATHLLAREQGVYNDLAEELVDADFRVKEAQEILSKAERDYALQKNRCS